MRIIRAAERFQADHGWLTSRFSFSFAEYYDRHNMQFGPLRVFNDDIVQPETGFGKHPHAEMEIVSYVISGELTHQDSTGNREVLRAGELQRMSAGTGVYHSEFNNSETQPVHFLQLWFLPDTSGLTPSYEQKGFLREAKIGNLLPVVSNQPDQDTLFIHQDLTIYLSILQSGMNLKYNAKPERRTYLFVIDGSLKVNQTETMHPGDAARIEDLSEFAFETDSEAEFMLIDLP